MKEPGKAVGAIDLTRPVRLVDPEVADAIIGETDGDKRLSAVAAEVMMRARPLAKHGEVGRGRNRDDQIISKQQGTSAAYLASRLKRDRPDIAAAVERGEFPSIPQLRHPPSGPP